MDYRSKFKLEDHKILLVVDGVKFDQFEVKTNFFVIGNLKDHIETLRPDHKLLIDRGGEPTLVCCSCSEPLLLGIRQQRCHVCGKVLLPSYKYYKEKKDDL